MTKKYKIEFHQTRTFVIDTYAKDEDEAIKLAKKKFEQIEANGMEHYHEWGDKEITDTTVYDVTETDDPFHP